MGFYKSYKNAKIGDIWGNRRIKIEEVGAIPAYDLIHIGSIWVVGSFCNGWLTSVFSDSECIEIMLKRTMIYHFSKHRVVNI